MSQNENKKIVIVPPGYHFTAGEIQAAGLQAEFLDSVDGEFLDSDNYAEEVQDIGVEAAELPQAFKDYEI